MKEKISKEDKKASSKIYEIIEDIEVNRGFTAFQRMRIKKYLPYIYDYFFSIELLPRKESCRDIISLDTCPTEIKEHDQMLNFVGYEKRIRDVATWKLKLLDK